MAAFVALWSAVAEGALGSLALPAVVKAFDAWILLAGGVSSSVSLDPETSLSSGPGTGTSGCFACHALPEGRFGNAGRYGPLGYR